MSDTLTLWSVIVPLCAYLLGSILPAELLARRRGVDLRGAGGNPGTMETHRLFGLGPAVLVFIADVSKGILPVALGWWLQVPGWSLALAAVMAIAGHNWSAYYGFWGGRGLATATGVYAVLFPQMFAVALTPSLLAWRQTKWVPASGIVGLSLILALVWLLQVDPARRAAASVIPLVMLIRQTDWIRERLADVRAPARPPGGPRAGSVPENRA